MDIEPQFLQPYLHEIAINQLTADYETKGYRVSKEEKIGNSHADLVARKGEEVIIIEVSAGKPISDRRQQVTEIGDYVRTHKNHKFLVVLASQATPKRITISGIDQLLQDYLTDNYHKHLSKELFADVRVISVTDVTLNELTQTKTGIEAVKGTALVELELRYSDSMTGEIQNDAIAYGEIFPCTFDVLLTYASDSQFNLQKVNHLTIDTSD